MKNEQAKQTKQTEQKHTPGPWETGALITNVEVWPDGWNVPMCIADCSTKRSPESNEEKCANARLIAAAPDLLEACEESLRALRIIYDNTDEEDLLARLDCWPLTKLHTAITKATELEG